MTHRGRLCTVLIIAALVLLVVLYFAAAKHWLSLTSLRTHRDSLMQFVSTHYWEALFLSSATCLLLVALSAPASGFLMLLCGLLFGCWIGGGLVAVFATLGAAIAMLMVRHLFPGFVHAQLQGHRRAQRLIRGLNRHKGSYLLFMRLVPGFPFWLTNIMFALTEITVLRFLYLTLLGITPDSFIYSNVGANLATVKSARDMLSPASIIALALLAVSCLSPVLLNELQRRKILRPGWPLHRA